MGIPLGYTMDGEVESGLKIIGWDSHIMERKKRKGARVGWVLGWVVDVVAVRCASYVGEG